ALVIQVFNQVSDVLERERHGKFLELCLYKRNRLLWYSRERPDSPVGGCGFGTGQVFPQRIKFLLVKSRWRLSGSRLYSGHGPNEGRGIGTRRHQVVTVRREC